MEYFYAVSVFLLLLKQIIWTLLPTLGSTEDRLLRTGSLNMDSIITGLCIFSMEMFPFPKLYDIIFCLLLCTHENICSQFVLHMQHNFVFIFHRSPDHCVLRCLFLARCYLRLWVPSIAHSQRDIWVADCYEL